MKLTGQCHCGALAFEVVNDAHLTRTDCTCRDCQRATGCFSIPFVSVDPHCFRFTRGDSKTFKAPNGTRCDKHGKWILCPTCGGRVLWLPDDEKFYTVLCACFDDVDAVNKLATKA